MVADWASDICRLCLLTGATHHLWPERVKILTTYSTFDIKNNSVLPNKICDKCMKRLDDFYLFFKRASNAQSALENIAKKFQNFKNDGDLKKKLLETFEMFNEKDKLEFFDLNQSNPLEYLNLNISNEIVLNYENKFSSNVQSNNANKEIKIFPKTDINRIDTMKTPIIIIKNDSLNNTNLVPATICKDKNIDNYPILPFQSYMKKNTKTSDKNLVARKCIQSNIKPSHMEFFLSSCCSICNIQFLTHNDLALHNLNIHFSKNCLPTVACDICKKEYKNKYILAKHKKKNHLVLTTPKVICDKCNRVYTSSIELKLHKKSCDKISMLDVKVNVPCTICNKIFENKKALKIHMESHVTNVCEYCNHGFTNAIFLLNHVSEKHSVKENPYSCYQCNKNFFLKDMLLKHNQIKHNFSHEIFYCGHCNLDQLIFNNVYELWSHMESIHNSLLDVTETPMKTETKLCRINPNMSSAVTIDQSCMTSESNIKITEIQDMSAEHNITNKNNKDILLSEKKMKSLCENNTNSENSLSINDSLNSDKIICKTVNIQKSEHTTEKNQTDKGSAIVKKKIKNFQCKHCSKKFLRLLSLQKHMIIHKAQKPICLACNFEAATQTDLKKHIKECKFFWKMNNLLCPICKKNMTTLAGLRYHLKIHSADPKFKCSNCPRRFITVSKLNLHMRVMHSEIRPFVCNLCPRTYAVSDHLRKHVLFVHTNQRNHICNICTKAFLQKSHLNHHMWIHTGVKPHKCPYCANKYSARCSLTKHLRRNHWEQQHGKANIDDLIKKIKLESVNSVEETENDVTDGISVVIVGDENSFNEIIFLEISRLRQTGHS